MCQLPVVEFGRYRAAFAEAETVAQDVLAEAAVTAVQLAATVAEIEAARQPQPTGVGLPPAFDPTTVGVTGGVAFDIEARLRAFAVIGRYNDALLALAEGQTPQRVRSSVTALSANVIAVAEGLGTSVPGFGLATPLIRTFLTAAETARSRAEFARALDQGRPIVDRIITFLREDTRTYDQVRHARANRLIDLAGDTANATAVSMARLARDHAEPTDARLVEAKRSTAGTLQSVLRGFGVDVAVLPYRALPSSGDGGSAPYSTLVQSQLDQLAQTLREQDVARQRAVADVARHQEVLANYVALLNAMEQALAAVQARLDTPSDVIASAAQLTAFAVRVRSGVAVLRARPIGLN